MKDRIEAVFERLREDRRMGLIPFLAAGYPDMKTTYDLCLGLDRSGADIIELGVPFSDPLMDGPVIQKAYEASLQAGITLSQIIDLVKEIRLKTSVPLVLMSSYNPIYQYGIERFVVQATEAGVDGVIVPDLPPEEADELKTRADKNSLATIFLLAPTSIQERVNLISRYSTGFIYYISVTGITGARENLTNRLGYHLKEIRLVTHKPIAVGFGISKKEHLQRLRGIADAVVVGSAIISLIKENLSSPHLIDTVCQFIKGMRD